MFDLVIVDDDDDYRLVVKVALSGHPLLSVLGDVGDLSEGAEVIARLRPDFILLDLALAGTNGHSAVRQLKEASPNTSIIATSASPEEDGGLALPTGSVLGHLSKEVAPSRLGVEILLLAELIDAVDTAFDVASTCLPHEPASAAAARRFVEQTLSSWQCDEVIDTVKLLVSELVGNAVGHAHSKVEVRVHLMTDRLRVEVVDDEPDGPRRRTAAEADASGRGIAVVEALADSWGVSPRGTGKVVWFELPRPSEFTAPPEDSGASVESSGRDTPVDA